MTSGLDRTEEHDGRVTVSLLDDDAGREEIPCSSYREAIDLVGEKQYDVTVAKIVDKDGEVVFPSHDMDIDPWESV